MIDIHCHILPGLDDGSPHLEESLAMARIAVQDGIRNIIATPHVMTGVYPNRKDRIIQAVADFNQVLETEGLPLHILPGAECHLETNIAERLSRGELVTLNNTGKYLLIELPSTLIPGYAARAFYDIQMLGVTPIIAHPERNAAIMEDPMILEQFAVQGVLSQVTSHSISGIFGKTIQKAAIKLIQGGFVQLIASDAHSSHRRSPVLSQALARTELRWGEEFSRRLVYDNPRAIMEGLVLEPSIVPRPTSLWNRLVKKTAARK